MPTKNLERVRIKYFCWDTDWTGRWKLSHAITPGVAKKCIKAGIYERPTIIKRGEKDEGHDARALDKPGPGKEKE